MKKLLKKNALLCRAIYLLLLVSSSINARYLPADWQPAPQLGSAYSSNKHKVFAAKCVNANKTEVGEAVGDFKYSTQATFEKIASAFSGSVEAKMSVPFNKASASMSYAQENAATDQRMNWFLEFHATPKSISLDLDNLELSPFGQKMLNNQSRLPNICGDEFVYQIDYGAKLIATMSIEFASKEDKDAFQTAVSVNVDVGVGSVGASGSVSAMQQRMGSRTTVKIEIRQTGGNPGRLAGILNEKVVDCNLSNMQACLDTFGQVLKYAKKDFRDQVEEKIGFSVVRYHTMPYEESMAFELVPNNGFPMLNNLVKLKREQIQEKYEKQSIAYSRARYIKAKLENFVEKEQLLKIEEIYKNSFANMTKLTEAMNVCLEHSADECINFSEELISYDLSDLEVKISEEIDPKSSLGKLFKAVKENNTSDVHTIIKENGAQLISRNDPWGYSSFHRAIEHAHHEMVDLLIRKGPQKNQTSSEEDQVTTGLVDIPCDDKDEYTPLCLAAKGGTHEHISCMNLLCVAGAGIDCATKSGLTPLQVAVMHGQIQTAKELIKRGANKKILDKHGSTLLHLAAEVGDVALINYLIDDAKLAVNAQDKKGLTPLHKAAHAGKINAVENLLLKGGDPKILDNQGETALHWGIKHKAVVKKLLSFYELPIRAKIINPNNGQVVAMDFSPDGRTIAMGSRNNGLELCDLKTGEVIAHTTSTEPIYRVSFRPDGKSVITDRSFESIVLWQITDGSIEQVWQDKYNNNSKFSISPDGKKIANIRGDNITLRKLNTTNYKKIISNITKIDIKNLRFSRDGKSIISNNADNSIKIWNIDSGENILTIINTDIGFGNIAISPDGTTIASHKQFWNISNGESVRKIDVKGNDLIFNPDGKTIATCHKNTVKLWNAMTGQLLHTLTREMHPVTVLVFSPDGTSLLTSTAYNEPVKLWNLCFDSILHQAVRAKKLEVAKMIAEKFPLLPFIRTPQGQSTLELAKELQHTHTDGPAIVELLNKHLNRL